MYQYFIHLLRCALHGTTPDAPPADLDWAKLYHLADLHSAACTVYYAVAALPADQQPEPDVFHLFRKAMQITLGRESLQHFEIRNVMDHFEKNGISYLPIKGWRLKHLYPRPDMRSMCDVDILISGENVPQIPAIMEDCGFHLEIRGENHDAWQKTDALSVELHHSLFAENSPYYGYFKDYMDRAAAVSHDSLERQLSHEDFYIYLIAHMAKHFRGGGTGVRSLMDIYEYRQAYGGALDTDYIDAELDQLGLKGFSHAAEELAQSWFATDDRDADRNVRPKMAMHILSAGTYGRKDFHIVSSIQENDRGKYSYLLHRFFPPRSFMQTNYPCLHKAPFLLPLFWVVRGFRSVFVRGRNLKYELQAVKQTDIPQTEYMDEVWRDSGLLD